MQLPLQDFGTLVKTQVAAVSSSCQRLIDMTVGSVLRAILEANASVGLWMQWLIMQVLAMTRAATSNGTDLDTWVEDFGMERLPASIAAGQVQFSRVTPGLATTIPVGALIRTGTETSDQVFVVSADPSNQGWNGAGYQVDATALSVTTPVVARVAGMAGNVRSGTVVQLATAIPGIDTVTNAAAMAGGLDAETDDALRTRFAGFLDSRTRATAQAVGFAIASVRQGVSFTISERTDSAGAVRPGHFTVTVDDGSGAPAPELIQTISAAVDAVRPIGGTYSIRSPILVPVDLVAIVVADLQAVTVAQAAVNAFISALPIGAPLMISKLYQVVHDSDPRIVSISSLTVNSGKADIQPGLFGLIRPNQVTVTT